MATRKSEWLASIKPILDRDEAKRDAKELAKELGDLLEIDIDASPENLKKLTDEFNKQLSQMGKQPIVFSEKTLQGIVNQFANAVAEGFSKGADVGLSETLKLQLENLKKQREAIIKEQERARKDIKARSRMEKLEGFEIQSAKPIKVDGDIGKEAQRLVDILYDSADKIDQAQDKFGKQSTQYRDAVLDAQEAYHDYLRMQQTLGKMQPSQLSAIPKDVRALYDKLGQERDKYEASGGVNIPFVEDFAAEKIADAFEELSDEFEEAIDNTIRLEKRLKKIDAQIEEISKQARELGLADSFIPDETKKGLKTLKEIEDAYDRIAKKSKKTGGKALNGVSAAVDYVPGSESLATLRNRYNTSLSSNEDWEVQYQWLVKFVKEYENYSAQIEAETDSIKRKNMKARQKQYTALYEELKPMTENAETMLRGIIDVSGGKQPTGVKDANKQDVGAGPTSEDVANAEQIAALERQAKEDAAAKAKAEAEAAEAAKQKRIEEEKAAKAAEKKRIADEAAAEAQRKAAEEAERERLAKEASVVADKTKTYTGYRAIEPTESSGKTKHDALADWGAEYFSTNKNVAASYGENFFKEGNIVIGEITPKNPLVINANGLRWDEFDKMPGIKELFPGILELMKDPRYIGDDGQKYINEQAKLAGYDAVVLENVQDALDGDIKEYGLSTTIAVLDDKIISLTGSMAQLEAGTNRFADAISAEIPSYYVRSDGVGGAQSGGLGDDSSADLEAERAKAEAFQNEVEQKNQELTVKDDEIARIQAESEAEKRALDDAKATLQNDLDETRQQLADSEYEKGLYDSAMNQLTEESNEKDRIIYDLREQLANVKTGTNEEQVSASSEELKNVLGAIVYNVKIVHDDNDKTANKIALDEGALEQTLKRVFANVISPQTEQNDSEPKNAPWALEKTLLNVNETLSQIQTNTAKPESVEIAPVKTEVGNILATENTLVSIKTTLASISNKLGKSNTLTSSSQHENRFNTSTNHGFTQTDAKNLIKDYETLGRLRAQLENDGDEEIRARLQVLAAEVERKRESMRLTTDEIIELRNKSHIAYEAEKKLLDAAKRKQKIDEEQKRVAEEKVAAEKAVADQQKKAEKDAKRQAASAKKEMQKQAMLGKAGNAVGRAQGVYIEAEGLNPKNLPKSFTQKGGVLDSYYSAFEKLRQKQVELSKLDVISDKQKKDLRSQINNVNQMTSEIGELVSQYQRLSGDNVKELGVNTLRPNAGLKEYEAELKRLASASANGKLQIKGFDNETKTLTYTVKNAKREVTTYTATLRGLDKQFVAVAGSTKRSETFIEATKRKMGEISSYMSGMAVLSRATQELRRGIQYVREIDLALTELKKVTDETEETYGSFLETAAKTADKVGSTIQKVVSSTADWARLGYSMKEAAEFAESTQILMNVSEFTDVSTATDTLISAVQAFGYTAETSMDVVDLLNTIGKIIAYR